MASIKKRGKYWQVRYSCTDLNGREHTKNKSGFTTKQEATIFASQINIDHASGIDLAPKNTTFADYFDYWHETYKKANLAYTTKQCFTSLL